MKASRDHAPSTCGVSRTEADAVFCELCDEPASESDWSAVAQMLICQRCLERMAEDATADNACSEVGLVGGNA